MIKNSIINNIVECSRLYPEYSFTQILFVLGINQVDPYTLFDLKPKYQDNFNISDEDVLEISSIALNELKNKR